jgi:hypothetical protein
MTMTAYELGKTKALEKLGWNFTPLAKMVGRGALAGGGVGAVGGGISGAIAAPEGEGLSGFGRGALAGGLTGAALGGAAGGLGARSMASKNPLDLRHAVAGSAPGASQAQAARAAELMKANPALRRGMQGAAGAGLVGGGMAGVAAAPEQKPWHQKALATLGLA